jgi:hypothetical protein
LKFLKKKISGNKNLLPTLQRTYVVSITKTDRIILFMEGIALRAVRSIWIHPVGKTSRFAVIKKAVNKVILKGLTAKQQRGTGMSGKFDPLFGVIMVGIRLPTGVHEVFALLSCYAAYVRC